MSEFLLTRTSDYLVGSTCRNSTTHKIAQRKTFGFISLELDKDDKKRYKELGAPVLNMIWMRTKPTFAGRYFTALHRVGRLFKCLFLSGVFVVLRLFIPIWFMYMLLSSDNNKYAFDQMSGLNPCDPSTEYVTWNFMQYMCFTIVIGVLAIIVFKAEEDVLRIAYWAVIYLHLNKGFEKLANMLLITISMILVLTTSVAFTVCTIYYCGISIDNSLGSSVDGNYSYGHGINIVFIIAQLPALLVILEFDDIIRGHLRFDSNTGTRIEDILEKIKHRYLIENYGDEEQCSQKASRVEIAAIKLAKVCHHFTILVIIGACLIVFLDVVEIWDIKFVDYYDRDADCTNQGR